MSGIEIRTCGRIFLIKNLKFFCIDQNSLKWEMMIGLKMDGIYRHKNQANKNSRKILYA